MDKVALGARIADARDAAGMTQESVARAVGLDRTAIVLLEKGERNLRVPELVEIAQVLGRPLSFFVEEPPVAVVSRRQAPHAHDSTRLLDAELEQFALDVRMLAELKLLPSDVRPEQGHVPATVDEAERAAATFRRRVSNENSPVADLGRTCEAFGLFVRAVGLGPAGPDGGCVEVQTAGGVAGVAVINGDADPGRRRMTVAHELGHWLFGDAFDAAASVTSESMINAFAIHFLAPRAGVAAVWSTHPDWALADRALAVGVEFRLSWTAVIGHLCNLGLLSHRQLEQLAGQVPRAGDFMRLGLTWQPDFDAPYRSPAFVAAALNGYTSGQLTQARTLELVDGILGVDELPRVEPSLDELRPSFAGHADRGPDA